MNTFKQKRKQLSTDISVVVNFVTFLERFLLRVENQEDVSLSPEGAIT